MTRTLRNAVALVALIVATPAAEPQEATRTMLAVDISGSSTFLFDQRSADAAGAYVETYVAGLDAPHDLRMVSVGDAGLARRAIDITATVTENRASSARRLAPQFGGYFRALPGLVQRGEIAPQDTTSLIAFLHDLKPVCAAGKAAVIVFTDGVEWSAAVDGRALVAGTASLPKPDSAFLQGCSVTMLGVGQVRSTLSSDGLEERLAPEWTRYLTEAGAAPVSVSGGFFSF